MPTTQPREGRCQHCQQTRPLFKHEGELQYWGYEGPTAWLCARDYSAREVAVENGRDIRIERDLIVFPAA
ncbi:hypothetical protein [Streptomyces sp. NBC_01506]|uniref:hypothetical protein n=1 Tax=Streptomyces sp. NBC_01506 TaxID=2903887 RepID=UPI003870AA25